MRKPTYSTYAERSFRSTGPMTTASPAYGPETASAIERLIDTLRWADGHIWSSPGYHGARSGTIKGALNYVQSLAGDQPSFLYNKLVALISTSAGLIVAAWNIHPTRNVRWG